MKFFKNFFFLLYPFHNFSHEINTFKNRWNSHPTFLLDGYLPYETKFTRNVDGWIAGNIVFGGLIGLAIDAITGGMYKLTPDQVVAEMKNGNSTVFQNDSGLYLTIVMHPEPNWEKIGQLKQCN